MLNVPTLLGGLIFLNEPVGVTVAGAIIVSLVIASQIHKRTPMSRLAGLCHIVFIPAIVLLAFQARSVSAIAVYDIWVVYSLVMMSICVLIDLFDLYRYFVRGNQTYSPNS